MALRRLRRKKGGADSGRRAERKRMGHDNTNRIFEGHELMIIMTQEWNDRDSRVYATIEL